MHPAATQSTTPVTTLDFSVVGGRCAFLEGEKITFRLAVTSPAFIAIIHYQADGRKALVFPNHWDTGALVPEGVAIEIPGADSEFEIESGAPFGIDHLEAVAFHTQEELALYLRDITQASSAAQNTLTEDTPVPAARASLFLGSFPATSEGHTLLAARAVTICRDIQIMQAGTASPPEPRSALPRFDAHDFGWVILSIGMAIGAGIVFLPVQVGIAGFWAFLLSAAVGYPAVFLFQRLFMDSLSAEGDGTDYTAAISRHLGRNAAALLGLLYLLMLALWLCVYSTALANDSASYLQTFALAVEAPSHRAWYPLAIVTVLVLIASRGEGLLFRISTFLVLAKLGIVLYLGAAMVGLWNPQNTGPVPEPVTLARNALATLPFTLTSIIFLQTLSPMASSYRSRESSPEVARRKALRAMTIAFGILFVAVVFFAISFALALGPARAQEAFRENISALALAAKVLPPGTAVWLGAALNIFALVTAFFGVYLGFHEAVRGITLNLLIRVIPEDRIPSALIDRFIQVLAIALAFTVTRLEIPVLYFTTASGPLFGIVGCIIPVCLVLKAPALAPYRHLPVLAFITLAGILLILLPFMGFL